MTPAIALLLLAAACGLWAGVSAVFLADALGQQGIRTPFPFWGVLVFRNLHRYSALTRSATGRIGPLFYSYVVAINVALTLVVIALIASLSVWQTP